MRIHAAPRSRRRARPCACIGWLCVVAIVALSGRDLSAKDPYIRHFRAGALIGANINAEFSQSGVFSRTGGPLGDFSGGWEYDDGFVRPDNSEGGSAGGYTSNWGYNNAAQYDAAQKTLTFSRTDEFSVTDISSANSDPHFGLDLAYGGTLKRIGRTWFLWELGFSLLPIDVRGNSSAPATLLGQETYTFKTGSIFVPLAPYAGSPGGGPLLATNYSQTTTTNTSSSSPSGGSDATVQATREIEAVLYNLRLGPHVHWDLNRQWSVELMGGLALGLVDGAYDFKEQLVTATGQSVSQGTLETTEWLYGGYAGVLTQLHIEQNAYLYGSAQFMSLGNVDFSGGGRRAELQLDQGVYFSVGFTWLF